MNHVSQKISDIDFGGKVGKVKILYPFNPSYQTSLFVLVTHGRLLTVKDVGVTWAGNSRQSKRSWNHRSSGDWQELRWNLCSKKTSKLMKGRVIWYTTMISTQYNTSPTYKRFHCCSHSSSMLHFQKSNTEEGVIKELITVHVDIHTLLRPYAKLP